MGWARLVLVISGLWIFSIMAGAQPSVLRSAIMFTCIASGEVLNRKTSIYNSLSFSAFLVLCYNPFWLWDAGFQLSYKVYQFIFKIKTVVKWLIKTNDADYCRI